MMGEILSKTIDPNAPLREVEYYELSLLDEANDLGTRHVVKQWHDAWSEINRQIMWDQEEVDYFSVLDKVKARYEERRCALAGSGFNYSDIVTTL
jgi:hypothetical protein